MTSSKNSQAHTQLSVDCNSLKCDKSYINMIRDTKYDNLKDCHINCMDKIKDMSDNDLQVITNLFDNKLNIFQVFEAVKYYEDKLIKDFDYKEKHKKKIPKPTNYFTNKSKNKLQINNMNKMDLKYILNEEPRT